MSTGSQCHDTMAVILGFVPITSWTKTARVCRLWNKIIKQKRDELPFRYFTRHTSEDIIVRLNKKEYLLKAYNQFYDIFVNEIRSMGKFILASFLFAGFECQLEINISEMDLFANMIPESKDFSNETIIKLADMLYMVNIESYVCLPRLLKETRNFRLTLDGQNTYYSFHFKDELYNFNKKAEPHHYGLFNLVMSRLF